MNRALAVGLAVGLVGCGGPTIDHVDSDGNDTELSPPETGPLDAFPEWPPPEPPGQPEDVGDGTRGEPMLLIGETRQGPVYLWMLVDRQGDALTGELAEVEFVDGQWAPSAASRPLESSYAGRNCFVGGVQGITLSGPPDGDEPLPTDLILHLVYYGDQLLCGEAWFDEPDGNEVQLRYVAKPLAVVGEDPEPPLSCD